MQIYRIFSHLVDDCTMADEAHVVCTQHSGTLAIVVLSDASVQNLVAVQLLTPSPYQKATTKMMRAFQI